MNKEPQKNYYAIIPANVRYDDNLTANAKLLYGEITALCNEKGYCWAKNDYFSKLYKVSKTSISKWISQLVNGGYITNELIYKQGTKEIEDRYLRIVQGGMQQKLNTPIEEKLIDNNTSINNTINNTSNKDIVDDKSPTTPAKKKSKRVYQDNEEPMILSKYLVELMKRNGTLLKEPNHQLWANEIRLMHESDEISYSVIKNCIAWCQQDSFWSTNILSAKKLRSKFPTLYAQAQRKGGNNYGRNQQSDRKNSSSEYDNLSL